MKVSFDNLTFTTGGSTFTFNDPSKSLTLITGTGTDAILVLSTDPGFTGALLRYSDGGLTGALTKRADTVVIDLTAPSYDDGIIVDVTLNGYLQSFGALGAGVRSILLQGLGGNDTFTTNQVLPIDVTIDGGAGSDTLAGPAAGPSGTSRRRTAGPRPGSRRSATSRTSRAAQASTGSTSATAAP